ncbi:hypothetical protein I6U48_15635 [Clostridium sp. PL3]|uniref:Uncharacterized protein n=1 Tax=Clostridium thailandense TaxID=2794346 RepID=A0A949TL58_9CLOT|nr:hypothetical protein [Clostridium thailandense]MBV7274335.1 hypothetical protein [Clostridium thailandense]
MNGDKVTLIWKDSSKSNIVSGTKVQYDYDNTNIQNSDVNTEPSAIDVIKDKGVKAVLKIADGTTAKTNDVSGKPIASTSDTKSYSSELIPYDYLAAPKTAPDYWVVESPATTGTDEAAILLTFDTPLDEHSGIKTDDFIFTAADGTKLDVNNVSISGNTVKFTFYGTRYDSYFTKNNKISIRAKSSVSIRTQRDADGNYAGYTPSNDDCHPNSICTSLLNSCIKV